MPTVTPSVASTSAPMRFQKWAPTGSRLAPAPTGSPSRRRTVATEIAAPLMGSSSTAGTTAVSRIAAARPVVSASLTALLAKAEMIPTGMTVMAVSRMNIIGSLRYMRKAFDSSSPIDVGPGCTGCVSSLIRSALDRLVGDRVGDEVLRVDAQALHEERREQVQRMPAGGAHGQRRRRRPPHRRPVRRVHAGPIHRGWPVRIPRAGRGCCGTARSTRRSRHPSPAWPPGQSSTKSTGTSLAMRPASTPRRSSSRTASRPSSP